MATVVKRAKKDGSGYQVRYYGPDGKRRARTFDRRDDARKFAQSVETDKARGEWLDPKLGATSVEDYANAYLQSTRHLKPSTRLKVQGHLRNYIIPSFGAYPIGQIRPEEVREWVAALSDHGLAPATTKAVYRSLSRIMNQAVIDGYINRSPLIGVALPKDDSHEEMRFLEPSAVTRLADTIDARYRALIYTAAYTGLRWGELVALKLQRLDLLRGSVHVVESINEVNGYLHPGSTKTGARRTVSLPNFLVRMLDEHIRSCPSQDGFVFSAPEGGPLRRNFYRRHFKKAVVEAGLDPGLRFHDLRHTCAALLIAQGAHPKEIQARLGHSTIRLTFDRYGHLFPSLDDRLRQGLDETFDKARRAGPSAHS